MLNNINGLPRSDSHPNCIPLIQSSGYGKSRLVDELAKLVFTIPLNIRNPEEDEGESGMCVYSSCTVELIGVINKGGLIPQPMLTYGSISATRPSRKWMTQRIWLLCSLATCFLRSLLRSGAFSPRHNYYLRIILRDAGGIVY